MSDERLDLSRPRSFGELLDTAFALQRRWFGVFFGVTAVVYVPVAIGINGVWARQLQDGTTTSDAPVAATFTGALLTAIVVPALVTALHVGIVQRLAAGEEPEVASALRGLGAVALPAVAATAVFMAGVVLGLICLIVPGLILAVRWYFAPQVAVVEGARGLGAATRSSELVVGRSWEVFLRLVGMSIIAAVLVGIPEGIATAATDSGWVHVAAQAILGTIGASLTALYGTLLFFTLRSTSAKVPG